MYIRLFYSIYRNFGRFLSFVLHSFLIHLKFKILEFTRFSLFNCDAYLLDFFQQKHNKTAGCSLVSRNLLSPIQWFLFFQLDVCFPIFGRQDVRRNQWRFMRCQKGEIFDLFSPLLLKKATFSRYEVSAGLIWSWRPDETSLTTVVKPVAV